MYKNVVFASRFLAWYFSDSDDVNNIGSRVIESLLSQGSINLTAKELFDESGYIPQHICKDDDGDNEYEPSEVEFINDLQ
jgi:hypothetical protein